MLRVDGGAKEKLRAEHAFCEHFHRWKRFSWFMIHETLPGTINQKTFQCPPSRVVLREEKTTFYGSVMFSVSLSIIQGHQKCWPELYPKKQKKKTKTGQTQSVCEGNEVLLATFRPAKKWIFLVQYFSTSTQNAFYIIFFINISAFGLHCCKISEFDSGLGKQQRKKNKKKINTQ